MIYNRFIARCILRINEISTRWLNELRSRRNAEMVGSMPLISALSIKIASFIIKLVAFLPEAQIKAKAKAMISGRLLFRFSKPEITWHYFYQASVQICDARRYLPTSCADINGYTATESGIFFCPCLHCYQALKYHWPIIARHYSPRLKSSSCL